MEQCTEIFMFGIKTRKIIPLVEFKIAYDLVSMNVHSGKGGSHLLTSINKLKFS